MSRFCNKRPGYIKHGWVICKLNCACSSVLLKWLILVICTLVATEFIIYIFENALLKWVFWMSRHTDSAQSWLRSSWRENKKFPKGVWIVLVQRRTCMQLGCWSGSCEKGKKGRVVCEENVWPQVMDYWKPLPQETILQWQTYCIPVSKCASSSALGILDISQQLEWLVTMKEWTQVVKITE